MTTSGNVQPPTIPGLTFAGLLGQGGQAQVFEYVQALPARHVAVKVLTSAVSDADLRTQIVNEANVMAGLEHPFIVTIYAAGVTADDRPYLVMQYYPGGTLMGKLQQRQERAAQHGGNGARGLHVSEVVRLGIQIGGAVATAHAAGVLHRDIKPHNILLNAHGTPGLTDFGISSRIAHTGPAESVSLPWAPPEALRPNGQMTVASDVYSLGATLWHLLVGHPPFNPPGSRTPSAETLDRIERQPPPATGRPDVPPALENLLAHCLAKDPRNRPQTMHDLVRGLSAVERELRLPGTDAFLPAAPVDAARQEAAAQEAHLTMSAESLAVLRQGTSGPNPRGAWPSPPAPGWAEGVAMPAAAAFTPAPPWGQRSGSPGRQATTPYSGPNPAFPGPNTPGSPTGWQSAPPPRRRGRALAVGAGVVALLGVGVVAVVLSPLPGMPAGSPAVSASTGAPASAPVASTSATASAASAPASIVPTAAPPATTTPPVTVTPPAPAFPAVAVPAGSKECSRDPAGGQWAASGTANATTSCGFAINVRKGYLASGINGGTGTFHAYSPETKLDYVVTCSGTQPVLCTGGVRGRVIIYGGQLIAG